MKRRKWLSGWKELQVKNPYEPDKNSKIEKIIIPFFFMEMGGLEPPTPGLQSRCSPS